MTDVSLSVSAVNNVSAARQVLDIADNQAAIDRIAVGVVGTSVGMAVNISLRSGNLYGPCGPRQCVESQLMATHRTVVDGQTQAGRIQCFVNGQLRASSAGIAVPSVRRSIAYLARRADMPAGLDGS